MLIFAGAAWAGIVLDVGPETLVDLGRGGNWGRIFPAEDGWDLFFASGGDYQHVHLDEDLTPDLGTLSRLTGRTDLIDHGIAHCPDGTWLHVASTTEVVLDDSAWAFRYDADLDLLAEVQLASASATTVHRDMPIVCGEGLAGVGFFAPDEYVSTRFVELGEDAEIDRTVDLEIAPIATGAAFYVEDGILTAVGFPGNENDHLRAREYDAESLELVDPHLTDISPAGITTYWSQGVTRIGDHYVVAHMGRDETLGWTAQDGDVWLSVFNLDWRHEETIQVSENTAPEGGMQPGLAWKDDRLVVIYTRSLQLYTFEVTLDLVAAGVLPEPEDTGDTSSDTSGDTGDTSGDTGDVSTDTPEAPGGCRGGAAFLLMPLALALRSTAPTARRSSRS